MSFLAFSLFRSFAVLLIFILLPFLWIKALEVIVLTQIFAVCTWFVADTNTWDEIQRSAIFELPLGKVVVFGTSDPAVLLSG
jgi:hypothetical protein